MSDRCSLSLRTAREHYALAEEIVGVSQEYTEPKAGEPLVDHESNYGASDERRMLAERGVPFYGYHGEGGNYGPYCFAACDGEMIECSADETGGPVARVSQNGTANLDDVLEGFKYWEMRRKAIAAIEASDNATKEVT